MEQLKNRYEQLCIQQSDINEHLPVLKYYAEMCDSILETGVRGCVSSWALCYGLLKNNGQKYILLNDITECDIKDLLNVTNNINNITVDYKWCNNLDLVLDRKFDLVFIDTWHVYGQLKRELNKFAPITNKYIIMHDTTVDEFTGESIRCYSNIDQQILDTGFTREEIEKGLKYAIDDFLQQNSNWIVCEKLVNNNGLTILQKLY